MSRVLHFRSKKAYRKWLAFNWIHNRKKMGKKPHRTVYIRGHIHKVKHHK